MTGVRKWWCKLAHRKTWKIMTGWHGEGNLLFTNYSWQSYWCPKCNEMRHEVEVS